MSEKYNLILSDLPKGFSPTPPERPWGINFGGGIDSTTVIIECMNRGYRPDWILFADTGSERPETLQHVSEMNKYIQGIKSNWPDITIVKWIRKDGSFESIHDNCLRTGHLPSKAYGYSGCTSKWKIYPMDKWRKANGFQRGAFAVGYNASEARRIKTACQRGDDVNFTAWYPLVAWGINRDECVDIVKRYEFKVIKSSCFMCPNMRRSEWVQLENEHPGLFETAKLIEERAFANGNYGRGGGGLYKGSLANLKETILTEDALSNETLEDRCHHGGCFT